MSLFIMKFYVSNHFRNNIFNSKNILFILFSVLLLFPEKSKGFEIKISFFEGDFLYENITDKNKTSLYNPSIEKIQKQIEKSAYVFGKLLYFDNLDNFKSTVIKYYNIFSDWILLIDSQEKYDSIIQYVNYPDKNFINNAKKIQIKYSIDALVYTNIFEPNLQNINGTVPYINISNELFSRINATYTLNSINSIKANVFCKIEISKTFSKLQNTVNLLIAVGLILISIGICALLYYKVNRINPIDKEIYKIIYWLYALMIINLIIYIYLIIAFSENEDSPVKYYSLTVLNATESVYKSLLWFDLILFAFGWKSYYNNFSRSDLRWLIFLFIFIYLFFSLDFIISSITTNSFFGNFTVIDLKTLIFDLILSIYTIFCCLRGIKKINVINFFNVIFLIGKNALFKFCWRNVFFLL